MIHSIKINNFRAFKDTGFKLGKYITVIAGQNATGKSTLLGMLGNSSELKKKDGVPILQNLFRTEFSEIFKASSHDKRGSNLYSIYFSSINDPDTINKNMPFRATWQDKNTRFRLIPKHTVNDKKTEAKLSWPTLYLGLSRLFPIGEIKQDLQLKNPHLSKEETEWVINSYTTILLPYDRIQDVKSINTPVKIGVGISTNNYDYLVNSAGEDNIGQILLAVLSFKRLKDTSPNYEGGLLLIDEIEATLHPAVQIKLYHFLIKAAKLYNLQIVFTTHSMTLLEHISPSCEHNGSLKMNNIEIAYLSTANIDLEIHPNPPIMQIKYDLFNKSSIDSKHPKLLVYTEDEEARWFIRKLLPEFLDRLILLDIKLGCEQLLNLRKQDPGYFATVLFILDGDVSSSKIEYENVLTLPGETNPEEVFYNYLSDLANNLEHQIWTDPIARNNGFSIRYFRSNGPDSFEGKPREQNKDWFNKYLPLFERLKLYEYWASDNSDAIEDFRSKFINTFNLVAKINSIPKII